MEKRLQKKINECFDSTGFEKNIAIIGEYGSGKSTLIDEYKKLNQEKVIDVSLMSTLQKSKNEYSFGNNDLSKNLDILNNIYQILMYNLVPMDDYSEFYPDSLKAKKNRSDAIFILIISISTIVLWTQITDDPHLINSFDHGLLVGLLICSILVIAVICVINILKFFIMFNNFKLKKLILSTSNAGLELDEKDSVKNEEQFVQGLICFLDLYMKTHKLNKIIINFEDLDRVAGPITIEFLRELNIKLNTLMSRKNVVFLYSIRTGILEKDSKKGVNTRARTKFEKYFNYTIYLKSINTRHYKSFILDLKEIEEDESLELYMKKDANLVNIIEQCFQQTSNNYAKTNIELFTDFRVYKSYLKELTFNLNSFVESVEVTNLSQKIEISISGIIEATMMLFASKHAADFIEYYFEILDNYNPNVIKVNNKYEVKRLQLIKSIEKRIINKYTVSNDEIFSKMEIAFFNKFLELDSISTIKLHEKYEFLNIISIDPEEIYFKKADVNYLTYKNLLLKEKEVINLYETAISIEQNMYKEKFIQRPNVYLTKKFDQYIDLFDMKKEEKSNVIDIWIKTSLDNEDKVDACFINLLDEEFAFGLLYGTGEVPKSKNSSVIRFLEQNSITKSKSKTFKSKFDEVVVIVAEANKKICDNNFDKFEYKKILHDLLQRKSGITRNSLTGQLGDKVEQDYYKYNPEHKGNYIRKKSVQVVYDNLDY